MRKLVLLFFVLMSTILSCEKSETPNETAGIEAAYQMINGEWEWKKTVIINRINQHEQITSPTTENKTIRMVYTPSKTLTQFENNEPYGSFQFSIVPLSEEPESNIYNNPFILNKTNIATNETVISFSISRIRIR